MWVLSTWLFASLVHYALSQDCVNCLTVLCQTPPPDANNPIWISCFSCLQKGYPSQCRDVSVSFCTYALVAMGCNCSSIAGKLVQGLQPDVPPLCNAPPPAPSTPRPSIAAAPLPSTSSNGQPLQFIIPQMNFSCHGCLQTLNITLKEGVSAASIFYFQLWRRYTPISGQTSVVANELYQLNTSVPLTISTSSVSSSNVYSLPLNVCFQEGDTIGIQLPYNSTLRIATDNSNTSYMRQIPRACNSTTFSMLFEPSTNLIGSPLIDLVTVPAPTPSLSTLMLPLATSTQTASPLLTYTLTMAPTTVPPAASALPTIAVQPPMTVIVPITASVGAAALLLLILTAVLLGTILVCRRRKGYKPEKADGNNEAQEEISFKTFESGKLPTSRREQTTYRTEDGVSVEYDVPRHSEPFTSNEVRHLSSTSRGSPSLTVDSIGPCSIAPQSPEPQSEAHSSINLHSNLVSPSPSHRDRPIDLPDEGHPMAYETVKEKAITTEGFYDNPKELEQRPKLYYTLEDPDKQYPPRPQNPLSQTLDQTGNSIDETKMTNITQSSDDNTSLASSLLSFDVTVPSPHQQKANIYHVLDTTERDPVTGNRYHILEEQMRAQDDQSPKYGVYVPNARQREKILKHGGEKMWSQVSRTKHESDKKFFHDKGQFWEPASDDVILYEQLSKHRFREILREDVIVSDQLGSGAFGTVYKAQWNFPGGKLGVAVKVMKPSIAQGAKVKFLQEAAVMGQFFHSNVVKLHGVVTVGEPPMIVLELMPRGDLSSFLKNYHMPGERPPPTPTFLLLCSRDIACGMKYLSYKGFVHRDLAARNILLTDDLKCKIGDFGLSRDLDENPYYITHKGTIPLKWSAPEAFMYGKFSTSSDVYSYGMLLYEIWSCGCMPMANVGMEEAKRLLAEGYCQPPPPGCPRGIYEVMVQCWNPQHNYRPSFAEIQEYLGASDDTILAWSSSDREVSSQASVLGAPLSEGVELYKNLQQSYRPLEITA